MRYGYVQDEQDVRFVLEAAERAILGYDADHAERATARAQERLDALFEGHGPAPAAGAIIAATDDTQSELYGAIVLDTPYYAAIAAADPHTARLFASAHRIVSGLFVVDGCRGMGVGTGLLREFAAMHALEVGARYLDGFVDDRNGSADFYRRAGLTVMPHNTGLPARRPTNSPLLHVKQVNGHWFYLDLWAHYAERTLCKECRGAFTFVPEDGGQLVCPRVRVDDDGRRTHEPGPS
ncbi:hypothetical protein IU11_06525 [Cellulosimicrobium sp. MM]|nr:hypothetical protein IU11_06525 [Cellulosimicrobium sp. MM]